MALSDLQTFLQERLASFDETIDLTPGSPADNEVIQPLLRRLGSDPFTIDMGVFLQDRLNQEFPELPTKEGDAITDLLIKPAILLWDPIIRENFRIRQQLSFRDPTILTLDEAEALGANLFAERNRGSTSRGTARLYFARPQQISVGPSNFITAKGGLHFFPTETQSIAVEEMLFNVEGDLYYFDVTVVAENPGEEYNIGPDELVTIANLTPAVRLTNKSRFRFGLPAESAVDFVDRVEQDLTERSLVTERGIVAKVAKSFTDVTRLAVTGFNDPEMNRDVIKGGGLGEIKAGGVFLQTVSDGEGALRTRRIQINPGSEGAALDFTALIGPPGQKVVGFTMTVFDAFGSSVYPRVRDLKVRRVVNATTLDVEEQVLAVGQSNKAWTLRKSEITLSSIPGGILFPDTIDGTVAVPDDQVHIGGATDVFVRGSDLDTATLVLSSVVDDTPLLQGLELDIMDGAGTVRLNDLVLGTNYAVSDATYEKIAGAVGLLLQIMDPPVAGSYRVLGVTQTNGQSPSFLVTPPPSFPIALTFRWRLLDALDINLVEPKETKISGSDLDVVQGQDVVETASGVDFQSYGVGAGDILRIESGALLIGDYTVKQVLSPLFQKVQVDRDLPATASGVKYTIFRPNSDGGVVLPFVRITSIDLLDTSNQPVGTTIPYARPVDIQTRSFANAARGVKVEANDFILGLVGQQIEDTTFNVNGLTLTFTWGVSGTATVVFSGATTTAAAAVAQINAQIATATGGAVTVASMVLVDDAPFKRIGIVPFDANVVLTGGTAKSTLFGAGAFSSRQVRTALITNWNNVRPAIDANFDVVQVNDGLQIGFYDGLTTDNTGTFLFTTKDLQPEIKRHVFVGSRSFGSARLFFLEPTSIEFDANSFCDVMVDGVALRYLPDPTLNYQRIPALPSEVKPKDGSLSGSSLTSGNATFVKRGIQPGDLVVIDYEPLEGTTVLADPVPGLEFQILTIAIGNGVDKDIVFVKDDVSIPSGSVTRQGIAEQINKLVGQTICSINGSNRLEFEADASIIVRGTGSANAILGFPGTDQNNRSDSAGEYTVLTVDSDTQLTMTSAFPTTPLVRQQYKVFRKGVQRICSTQMAKNVAETGLYFFDLELVSQGTGDAYNIDAGVQMKAGGFKADGYYLVSDDPNLTFSPAEKVRMIVSPSILEVGTTDNPDNATAISGQNLQVNYERSAVVGNVQNFMMSETERVICQSPLARHLVPHFVRFDVSYAGGSQESEVRPDFERFIKGLNPNEFLEASDVERLLTIRGAKSITNPITLLAVVHEFDRAVTMQRSQDRLNTGRLAAFIPDVLTITRRLA